MPVLRNATLLDCKQQATAYLWLIIQLVSSCRDRPRERERDRDRDRPSERKRERDTPVQRDDGR